jgi:decaprenylphospho-beta-D-ribofuranose 2-oxidase
VLTRQHADEPAYPGASRAEEARASLSGWGNSPATSSRVVSPTRTSDLVSLAGSNRGHIARGLGRSYGDAAQLAGGTVVDMTSLTGVWLDAETGRVTATAGTSLGRVLDIAVPNGWFLPVTPGTRHVTVGGAIAADVHGKNHHHSGSFGQYVDSFDLINGSGELVCAEPGSAPFRATVGGMGLTGTITRATFRLIPIETPWMLVDTTKADDFESVMDLLSRADARYSYSVAWIDLTRSGRGRGVVSSGEHAGHGVIGARGPRNRSGVTLTAPPWMPRVVTRPSVRMFNELWYLRSPRRELERLEQIDSFFYPLDAISDWNRLYGRRGFLQYQFVVPNGEEKTLSAVAEELARTATPVALAVLKRLGTSPRGHLSFPLPGWTLAADLPLGDPALAQVLDSCDRLVAGAGGRVYLAKDSRLRAEVVPGMYPDLDEWQAIRAQLDPQNRIRSNLARRLELVG